MGRRGVKHRRHRSNSVQSTSGACETIPWKECALYLRGLISTAFQFYLISDVCIKDLTYSDMYIPLKEAMSVLSQLTNVTSVP